MVLMRSKVWLAVILLTIGLAVVGSGVWFGTPLLWGVLTNYIDPQTPTERNDIVYIFVLGVAALVGTITALAAIWNAYLSRKNLQNAREALRQQRDLDERRAQDAALQAYLQQMGDLLTEHELKEANPEDAVSLLARAQILTVLGRLDEERKRELLLFLYGAGLILKDNAVVRLSGADLRKADLSDASLFNADLREANLGGANLIEADLSDAILRWGGLRLADLSGAILIEADLSGAILNEAILRDADFMGACLSGASLYRTDLREARNLVQDQIEETKKGDETTQLPTHLKPPASWSVKPDEPINGAE
jgi:uncharacterized protein YjbI with pentapeptide repeats